ncbi:MAG: hypothetical protein HOP19_20285 [Acidobacteria bacterium]|nr:hypothetical protein [Acidobacteriota bacterium]
MHKFKRQYKTILTALLSAALSLGLLCNIVCGASGCLPAPSVNAVAEEHVPHCHQAAKSKQATLAIEPISSVPESSSHRCSDHQATSLFTKQDGASEKNAKTPQFVMEPSTLPLIFAANTTHQSWWPSRKAPPRVARHFQLRI